MTTAAEAPGAPLERLLAHVDMATEILREERGALLRGAYHRIAEITERKAEVLALLESSIVAAPRTARAMAALNRLVDDSRRNEMILAAARGGFLQARRRIAAIARANRGVVAYLEDGSLVSCRADRGDTDKSA